MNPLSAPAWAEVYGEDDFGIFAEFTLNAVRFAWRWIPPGRFLMGSPTTEKGRYDDEGPQHEVTIGHGFWMGETPVTQQQWLAIMDQNPSRFKGDQFPVESVNWHHSLEFAQKLNATISSLSAKLPSEAQWEYACRAGTKGAFHIDGSKCTSPTGIDPVLATLGWFDENSGRKTHPIRQKTHNAWGLYDMHGNVWEWCFDGKRTYTKNAERDVVGPMEEGAFRVVRGGSWDDSARSCRAAYRYGDRPGFVWHDQGLRLSTGQEPVRFPAEPVGAERRVVPERRSRG